MPLPFRLTPLTSPQDTPSQECGLHATLEAIKEPGLEEVKAFISENRPVPKTRPHFLETSDSTKIVDITLWKDTPLG